MKKILHRISQKAFTYTEVMVACGLFGIMAGSSVIGLTRMNNNAALSRLQTGASTVAQNQIDLMLSDGPFNPQKNQVPPVLTLGTQLSGSESNPTIPIYTDPSTGVVSVKGWMTSKIQDAGTSYNGQSLNMFRATVTVFYKFRGQTFSIVMSTVRASDI